MSVSRPITFLVTAILGVSLFSGADTVRKPRKNTKKAQAAPLPSGTQGPVPQVPLDSVPAVQPQVAYQNGQLSITAQNSTLGDILRAVHKQTSAEMDIPASATERVATHLGPGPAREVVAQLLNGSHFNYVLLGSPADTRVLTRVVLVAKTGPDNVPAGNPQQVANQAVNLGQVPDAANVQPEPEPEVVEEAGDENQDQAVEGEQPQPQDQPGAKTPQQLLQEMQQRQLQMQQQQQQQQQTGQPPVPAPGYPPPVPPRQPDQQ